MRLMDLFRIEEGNLSILGVMIGDDFNEQRERLIKEGMTSETWVLNKGSVIVNPETGVYTRYLKEATIEFEGINIDRIIFQAYFSSYPNDVADSFLGIALKMEKFGVPAIKPNWQVLDDRIVNQYRTHNALWDMEVNVTILGQGETSISLELSANITDNNSQIAEDAVGIYKSQSKLSRRIWQLEDYRHKSGKLSFQYKGSSIPSDSCSFFSYVYPGCQNTHLNVVSLQFAFPFLDVRFILGNKKGVKRAQKWT